MTDGDRFAKQRIADDLAEPVAEARNLAVKLGLQPYDVNYWVVDYDEMNELIAYGGFQHRYPHWRWGMQYDRQQKQGQYAGGKAFEIVNNDDPAHAFLQESNTLADQKAVITHVEAHSDFFANNEWFQLFGEGADAAAMLERHANAIADYMSDPDVERAAVERWIDNALVLEDNIDQHQPYAPVETRDADGEDAIDDEVQDKLAELDLSDEVKRQVFDEEFLAEDDDEPASFPETPQKDVLGFLRKHGKRYDEDAGRAMDMTEWQTDLLDMLRAEAYYFAPQKMTKVMNEGWACVTPDTPVFTTEGMVPMRDVVEEHMSVSDGSDEREVYDSNIIKDHETVTVETRRGFELTGSNNHRVRKPDGEWVRLDELEVGDSIEVSGGNGLWPTEYESVTWSPEPSVTLNDVAEEAGVSVWTVIRYRRTGRAEKSEAIASALEPYEGDGRNRAMRSPIRIPEVVDEQFGRLLGLLTGDGHISEASRLVGFTSESRAKANEFAGLVTELFDADSSVEEQGSRYRVYVYSVELIEFLSEGLGLPTGAAADRKHVPEIIKRSPKSVVAEFLRGLFDADGYAGDQGVILSTKSEAMSKDVQLLLTNFGLLSRRRQQGDGCYHVHLTGASADGFEEQIGFGYPEKAESLRTYLDELAWFETEDWTTEVTSLSTGTETVYDISVEETHRYAAGGLVNHNSYWESTMMTDEGFAAADEFLNYADHMARVLGSPGLNPYKLGMEVWEYVENRSNRQEVLERLLRVEGVTWQNLDDVVDFDAVLETLEPPEALASITRETLDDLDEVPAEYVDEDALAAAKAGEVDVQTYPWKVLSAAGLARRHYSLVKRGNRTFLSSATDSELEQIGRYLFDDARYDSVEAALADVDYAAGWDRMREIRESHNDVTFLDEFLTQEFVDANDYFTYEYSHATGQNRVASVDAEDVKKKLLLQFTNFGKPTVAVYDGNFDNRNELLLGHQYNGVMLDVKQAKQVLERVFELWGRPVNLLTIVKELSDHDREVARRRNKEPEPTEQGKRFRFDGEEFEAFDVPWDQVSHLAADDVDYDTKPEDWLA